MPCCSVRVRRASARPRRVSEASRARKVALSRSMEAVLITPSPCDRRRSVSTRAGVPSTTTAFRVDHSPALVALDDVGDQDMCATDAVGGVRLCPWAWDRDKAPAWPGWRTPSHRDRPTGDAVPHRAAPAPVRRRIRGLSRCSRTSPPSHTRVLTIMAKAIHTMPPCCFHADLIGLAPAPGHAVARPDAPAPPVLGRRHVPPHPLPSARHSQTRR